MAGSGVRMVGREQEMARVCASLGDAETSVTLLLGEAGIGKSRLLAEVVAGTVTRLTLQGGCRPLRTVMSLLPVVDAFDTLEPRRRRILDRAVGQLPAPLGQVLAGVMPRTHPGHRNSDVIEDLAPDGSGWGSGEAQAPQERLFVAIEALLSQLALYQPITLAIEDIHWADPDTLDLLTYLAAGRRSTDIHLLVTCRGSARALDGRVGDWVESERSRGGLVHVELQPLDEAAVTDLVHELTGNTDLGDRDWTRGIADRADGNPFFVEQLVAHATDPRPRSVSHSGTSHDPWAAESPAFTRGVPASLAHFLTGRVRTASPAAQEVMTALAIAQRPMPLTALPVMTDLPETEVFAAVRELEHNLLVDRAHGMARPRHALVAEALLEDLPGLTIEAHRRAAAGLQQLDDPAVAAQVAEHLRAAGDRAGELPPAAAAAHRAWELAAYPEAAAWYERTLELLREAAAPTDVGQSPIEPGSRSEVLLVDHLIRALDLSGSRVRAEEVARDAVTRYLDWPDTLERLRLLRLCAQLIGVTDRARGLGLLNEIADAYRELPPDAIYAETLDRLASIAQVDGDSTRAAQLIQRSVAVADAVGDVAIRADAHSRLASALAEAGDWPAAQREIAVGTQLARQAAREGNALPLLDAHVVHSDLNLKSLNLGAAAEIAERGLAIATSTGLSRSFSALLLVHNAAEAHLAGGDTDAAGRLVDPTGARPDDDRYLAWLRAQVQLRRGDLARAMALSEFVHKGRPSFALHDDLATQAELMLWNHQPEEALLLIEQFLPLAAVGGHSRHAGLLLALAARAVTALVTRSADSAGRVAGDSAPVAAAGWAKEGLARLDTLAAAMACDPFEADGYVRRAPADGAQWHAERATVATMAEPRSAPTHETHWRAAAQHWEELGMPHNAAYCWWNAAKANRHVGGSREDLRTVLHAGHTAAQHHEILVKEIARLASRARLPIRSAARSVNGRTAVANPQPDSMGGSDAARRAGLTAQEIRVLELLAQGLTNSEVGTALFISPKTASVHVTNLLRKLQLSNRAEAAVWATRHGIATDN